MIRRNSTQKKKASLCKKIILLDNVQKSSVMQEGMRVAWIWGECDIVQKINISKRTRPKLTRPRVKTQMNHKTTRILLTETGVMRSPPSLNRSFNRRFQNKYFLIFKTRLRTCSNIRDAWSRNVTGLLGLLINAAPKKLLANTAKWCFKLGSVSCCDIRSSFCPWAMAAKLLFLTLNPTSRRSSSKNISEMQFRAQKDQGESVVAFLKTNVEKMRIKKIK